MDCDWHLLVHANPSERAWGSPRRCVGVEPGYGREPGSRCPAPTRRWDALCAKHAQETALRWLVKYGVNPGDVRLGGPADWVYAEAIKAALSDALYLGDELARTTFSPAKVKQIRREAARIRHTTLLAKPNEVVYFCRREGLIKIGRSSEVAKRIRAIGKGGNMPAGMTVGPVELLATTPGGGWLEHHLHERFAASRIPGTEWFHPTPELLSLVDRYRRRQESPGDADELELNRRPDAS